MRHEVELLFQHKETGEEHTENHEFVDGTPFAQLFYFIPVDPPDGTDRMDWQTIQIIAWR